MMHFQSLLLGLFSCLTTVTSQAATDAFPLPDLPISNITIPHTSLVQSAYDYALQNVGASTLNHTIRSAYFSLLLRRKNPTFINNADAQDDELIVVACILHDLGWAITPIRSPDRRFEVDGAILARDFVISKIGASSSSSTHSISSWSKARLQLLWDSIALHTTISISRYAHPMVSLIAQGIGADFTGPNTAGGFITVEEYKEIEGAFPRENFEDDWIGIMCGLCKDKKDTVFDNFVGEFGREFGLDGHGAQKEEFRKEWEDRRVWKRLVGALDALPPASSS